MAGRSVVRDARQEFRTRADEVSPEVFKTLHDIATGATRSFNHDIVCKCGHRNRETFQVEDQGARVKAADLLLQHGWGRPGTAAPEKDESGLLTKDAGEMDGVERRQLLALLRDKLQGGTDGQVEREGEEGVAGR